jgi:hypothetical protein
MIELLKKFLPKFQQILASELRLSGQSRFVDSTYITGYSIENDVSIKIEILRETVLLIKLEWNGHSIIHRTVSNPEEETLQNFLFIVEEVILMDKRIGNFRDTFPNLPTEETRDLKLRQLDII